MLLLGRPGVGKTTVIREMARVLSDELHKRVVIVDTSNEIGGDGDVPHPAIGGARRMQVPDPSQQHKVMVCQHFTPLIAVPVVHDTASVSAPLHLETCHYDCIVGERCKGNVWQIACGAVVCAMLSCG